MSGLLSIITLDMFANSFLSTTFIVSKVTGMVETVSPVEISANHNFTERIISITIYEANIYVRLK